MKNIGLYIHIPFCEQKCPYCDFYSVCNKNECDRYTDELNKRIIDYSHKYRKTVDTIYFGGGTPSVLGSQRLALILSTIKTSFDVSVDAEITVEVNPCSVTYNDFKILKSAGFNRVSIGLQSANDNELKLLGRRHSADDAKKAALNARNAGFNNISLDLMLCVPNQTKESLTESIEFCEDCNVEHISAYILKIEENTHFYKIKDQLQLFDDDTQASMYLHVVDELEKRGYKQYEISNFSKPHYEGKHNLKYWRDEEYLGIGPSSHSFIDGKRFYYGRSLEDFYNNKIIPDGDGGDIAEYIMLKLRLVEGVTLSQLKLKYNYEASDKLLSLLNNLSIAHLIEFDGELIHLTKNGFLLSNSVINHILDSL